MIDIKGSLNPQKYNFSIFFLFLLITLANYYIYVGFAIKPYMIFSFLFLMINIGVFYFHRLHLFEVAMLLFYLVYMFSGAFSLYPASSLRIICGIILYLLCYFIVKAVIGNAKDSVIERALSDVGIFFNGASLILYFVGLKSLGFVFEGDRVYQFGVMLDRDYPRLIGLLQDPNFFVFYNTLFFSYYLCDLKSKKNKLGLILCVFANILTFSRGGILVMALVFLIFIIIKNPLKQIKLVLGIVISLFVTLYVAIGYMKVDIFGILQSRIEDFSRDNGSGRFELWGRALDFFSSHMIIGIGAFNYSEYNLFKYGDDLEVHNTFLAILSESGLVGMTCFCLFIFLLLLQLYQSKIHKNKPYLFLAFIGMILQMGFLSVIINDMFFLYIAIVTTYLNKENHELINEKTPSRSSLPAKKQIVKMNFSIERK
ncbi:O-antigen ligase family protein [Neobacillus niacini]|uniref:O-antigen ligase family protein n=1 Tax=Neobacillus niacini TaxID=86668 RepID=UPI003983338A